VRTRISVAHPFVMLAVVLGCERADSFPAEAADVNVDLEKYVTGDALEGIGPDGRFRLARARALDDIPIITEERAAELAAAFLRTRARYWIIHWERRRRASMELEDLELSPRLYFADTPHGRFPDGHPRCNRRLVGPWYIASFTERGRPAVGIAIAAYGTELEIRDGGLHEPQECGNYFLTTPVVTDRRSRFRYDPVSPEEAVARIGEATGAKITRVPELWIRGAGWHPLFSGWRLTLDRPIHVRQKHVPGNSAPGERAAVREVFVGPDDLLLVPQRDQPAVMRYPVLDSSEERRCVWADVPRRSHMPVRYDEVSLDPEGR
jgi:hypothetical protein